MNFIAVFLLHSTKCIKNVLKYPEENDILQLKTLLESRNQNMKRRLLLISLLSTLLLAGCGTVTTTETTVTAPSCEKEFTQTMNEEIPLVSVSSPTSRLDGSLPVFLHVCKLPEQSPLFVSQSSTKSHQLLFELDAVYPLDSLRLIRYVGNLGESPATVSVDVSFNGQRFSRAATDVLLTEEITAIPMANRMAKWIRIVFPAASGKTYGLQDFRVFLGEGLIVREAQEWSDAFLRYEQWTGADGIFSFNLQGDDRIGADDPITAFVFSDTFVGNVNPFNKLRTSNTMINNSIGYYDGAAEIASGLSFAYGDSGGKAQSAFLPNAYLGYLPGNLLDSDGLSVYLDDDATLTNHADGIMWKTTVSGNDFLQVDLSSPRTIGAITIWNYNENPDLGVRTMAIDTSSDGVNWAEFSSFSISKASGTASAHRSFQIDLLGTEARYLRFRILETYDPHQVGLGKLLIRDASGDPLFGQITASSSDLTVSGNETSGRLWLQDGIVIGDRLYLFPLLVKDAAGAFVVTRVGLISAPIVEGKIDFQNASYYGSPLQSNTPDGGILYYGAGVLDHSSIDGYVYIYGYKDKGGRYLTVARVMKTEFADFNAWTYYDGIGWSKNINDSAPLLEGVSPELSVTRLESGMFAGKYLLVAMENTTSGKVSYSLSDTPFGPFSDFYQLYQTPEPQTLNSAFTYNAKMHVHLSQPGSYLISYNVNALKTSALVDARIYHPRFLIVTEVKRPS